MPQLSPPEAGKRAAALALLQKSSKKQDSLSTLAAHAGIENIHNAPLAPPLHVATTYTRPADGIYHTSDSIYTRGDNPTRLLFEKTVFGLETWGLDLGENNKSGEEQDIPPTSWAFSSGMMAATAIVLAHSSPLTVILAKDVYHGVPTLLVEVFSRHRVDVRRVDMTGPPDAIVEEIRRAPAGSEVIVWMESPSNPLCEVVDIAAITTAVKGIESHVITTVVDVTMASPMVTRPLEVSISDHTISFRNNVVLLSRPFGFFCLSFGVVRCRHFDALGNQIFGRSLGCPFGRPDGVARHGTRSTTGSDLEECTDHDRGCGVTVGFMVSSTRNTDAPSPCGATIKDSPCPGRVLGQS